ncbi:MAG: SUMF1/EgtB/PvdO family nonheme iron enzyme, partial [Spirochaetales bacterium]|nr:SUMF1/EgtB/PvdO family nonheme iron enzyme [Spirochaetales bacterium]
MAKPVAKTEDTSQIEVRLKPFWGIRPGVYLTIIYAVTLLFILFMLLLYPGLRNNGTTYRIESVPSGAAISVDGSYAGSTPAKVFVRKGEHTITLNRPSFAADQRPVTTGGTIFGSLFIPKKGTIVARLTMDDPESFLSSRLLEISEWALISQFGPSYQLPRLISDTVSDFYATSPAGDDEPIGRFLTATLSSLNGGVFIADYVRALMLNEAKGLVPMADTIARSVHRILSQLKEKPALAFLAAEALQDDALATYQKSGWFDKKVAEYRRIIEAHGSSDFPRPVSETTIAGLPFVLIPAADFVMGMPYAGATDGELPHPEKTTDFYMLKGEVTRGWYAQFLAANPRWSPENKNALMTEGLADEWYLYDWDGEVSPDVPVSYVSYYAARAFAEWIGSRLTGAFDGYVARLPLESEWELAALANSSDTELSGQIFADGPSPLKGRAGVEQLMGSLWEWCATWFHPADYFVKPWEPRAGSGGGPDGVTAAVTAAVTPAGPFDLGAEAVVRGGSWANTIEDRVSAVVRGSQRPAWCTEFTGFRIVLVK